jgi:hypothetical protein
MPCQRLAALAQRVRARGDIVDQTERPKRQCQPRFERKFVALRLSTRARPQPLPNGIRQQRAAIELLLRHLRLDAQPPLIEPEHTKCLEHRSDGDGWHTPRHAAIYPSASGAHSIARIEWLFVVARAKHSSSGHSELGRRFLTALRVSTHD